MLQYLFEKRNKHHFAGAISNKKVKDYFCTLAHFEHYVVVCPKNFK